MATASDIIKGAMRLIGVIASGENPSGAETQDGLTALNEMIDSWSNEGLMIHARVREEFNLVSGTAAYTIGTGGDFDTSRPIRIEYANIEDQSAVPTAEYPVGIMNLEDWASIPIKDVETDIPTDLYMDDAYPLATINVYPKPTAANKLVLYSWKPLSRFATSGTDVSLPPGYLETMRYNLAVRLAPEFSRPVPAEVVQIASDSKANVKRANTKPLTMKCDPAVVATGMGYNILTGDYR